VGAGGIQPAAGYSGTPLAKKLGLKDGHSVGLIGAPDGFVATLEPLPPGVTFRTTARGRLDVAIVFVTERRELERRLDGLSRAIFPDGAIWVAWPKKSSNVPTDITEDVIRDVVLPTGLVDNKVCAVDATWSGLRVVHRRENRR
jgi:hypothetical protein